MITFWHRRKSKGNVRRKHAYVKVGIKLLYL
jgi:hypothetical protein